MAFSDPLVVDANDVNYVRLDSGLYTSVNSTPTAYKRFSIKSTLKSTGLSDFVVKLDGMKEVEEAPDAPFSAYLVVRGNMDEWEAQDVRWYVSNLNSFIQGTDNVERILRGER
jgi:hypothetical protein